MHCSSLSRIDDVFVNFGEKKVTTHTLHWDAKTSFHLHTVAYDHARTGTDPSQERRHLELCRSVDCAFAPRFLAPVHVYIHFQAYWACLVVIETNEKPVWRHDASYIAWRLSKNLVIGSKTSRDLSPFLTSCKPFFAHARSQRMGFDDYGIRDRFLRAKMSNEKNLSWCALLPKFKKNQI